MIAKRVRSPCFHSTSINLIVLGFLMVFKNIDCFNSILLRLLRLSMTNSFFSELSRTPSRSTKLLNGDSVLSHLNEIRCSNLKRSAQAIELAINNNRKLLDLTSSDESVLLITFHVYQYEVKESALDSADRTGMFAIVKLITAKMIKLTTRFFSFWRMFSSASSGCEKLKSTVNLRPPGDRIEREFDQFEIVAKSNKQNMAKI